MHAPERRASRGAGSGRRPGAHASAGTDMRQQRAHLVAFLAMALGGPTEYRGQGMRQAHAGRGITAEHFGRVAGHLQATLTWANVGAAEVAQIMAAAASLQDDVTGAPR
ncbi:MAG: group I truncated hemoglobin [Planctomycetota bacterium]